MEQLSETLSALSVLYAFIFIYAQILSDKIAKFLESEPIVGNSAQKRYKLQKRFLCFSSLLYFLLNLAILIITVPIVSRIIRDYSFSLSLDAEILPAFVLCVFCFQVINFLYSLYLVYKIHSS